VKPELLRVAPAKQFKNARERNPVAHTRCQQLKYINGMERLKSRPLSEAEETYGADDDKHEYRSSESSSRRSHKPPSEEPA